MEQPQTAGLSGIEVPYPDGRQIPIEEAPLADVEATLRVTLRLHEQRENSDNRYALSGERAATQRLLDRAEAILERRRAEEAEAA